MRFKIFWDELSNTLTVFEDDSGYVFLFFILIAAVCFNAIITFLSFLAYSIILIVISMKSKTIERGAMIMAIGSAILGLWYCVLIALSILRGINTSAFIVMLQVFSTATATYSVIFSAKGKKAIKQNESTSDLQTILAAQKCQTAGIISIVTLAILFTFFGCLYIFNVPSPEDVRNAKLKARAEAQIAESVSIWDLDIIESDAIYGNATKYDSQGNVYKGEFREFCAWATPTNIHEPVVVVDINNKYQYKRFTGTIFTRPTQDERLGITFKIFADNKCIYDSGEMHTSTRAINLNLNITDVNELKFQSYTDDYDATNPAVILVNAVLHAE